MKNNITVLIKTMIRPKSLCRLVGSLLKYYPDIKILVADDGEPSSKSELLGKYPNADIEYYDLPKDSGLSYGRNFLLDKVKTPYFLLCDDDFVIDNSFHLDELIQMLEGNKLDILGGYFRNYKIVKSIKDRFIVLAQKILHYELDTNYIGSIENKGSILEVHYIRKDFPEFTKTDICHNFFLAKTDRIKALGGWDNELKLQEHTEFFVRAKAFGIKVGFTNKMSVKHFPEQSKNYSSKRGRDFSALFLKKYGFKEAYYYFDESERNSIEYFDENGTFCSKSMEG